MNAERVLEIITCNGADRIRVLAILQDIQREYNFLPREALELAATRIGMSAGEIYRLATFFKAFSPPPSYAAYQDYMQDHELTDR